MVEAAGAVLGGCSDVIGFAQQLVCDFNRLLLPETLKAAHAEIKQRDEVIASLRAQLAAKETRENSHQSSDSLTRQIKDRLRSINQLLQDEMEVVPSNSHKQDAVDALLLLAESGDDPVTE